MTLPTNETPTPPPPPVQPNFLQTPPPVPPRSEQSELPPEDISLSASWYIVLIVVGGFSLLITVAVAKLRVGSLDSPEKFGEFIGLSFGGWGLMTLVICAAFSLFKSFRKNSRKLASVAMILWTLIALVSIGQFSAIVSRRAADRAASKNAMRDVEALSKRAAQTTDPREVLEIQRQIQERTAEYAKNYSNEAQKQQAAMVALTEPFQKLNVAYTETMLEFIEIKGGWMSAFSKSSDAIKEGRERIKAIAIQNKNVLNALDELEAEINRRIRAKDTSSGMDIEGLKAFKSAFDPKAVMVREIRNMDAQLFEHFDKILILLQDNPSLWERHDSDNLVHCKDDAFQLQLQKILDDSQIVAEQQEAFRKKLLLSSSPN